MRAWLLLLAAMLSAPIARAVPLPAPARGDAPPSASRLPFRSAATPPGLASPLEPTEHSESLEEYLANSLEMLELSLFGLGPPRPAEPRWVAFPLGALRIWARTGSARGTASYAITAPSLLGVTPEILLEAGGTHLRLPLDVAPTPDVGAPPESVPQPTPALLVMLGLGLLRAVPSVR